MRLPRRLVGLVVPLWLLGLWSSGQSQPIHPEELRPGLVASYQDGGGAEIVRLDPTIGLTWKAGEAAHPRLAADAGRVQWQGYLNILRPGAYRFSAQVRGKLKVLIAGKEVLIAETGADAAKLHQGPEVKLEAGPQPLAVEFTRLPGPARLTLFWQSPFFATEPVPYDVLFHLPRQAPARLAADFLAERGRLLAEEHNCTSCHRPDASDKIARGLLPRPGPDLSQVGGRVHAGWLYEWIGNPQQVRPGALMPRLFADSEFVERYAVARYLAALGGPAKPPAKVDVKGQKAAAGRGQRLFASLGCVACHQDSQKQPIQASAVSFYGHRQHFPLAGLGSKTTPDKLAAYLVNPLAVDSSGRMPNMLLDAKEATDLAYFLCESTSEKIKETLPPAPSSAERLAAFKKQQVGDPAQQQAAWERFEKLSADDQWRELGKLLVHQRGCTACHTIDRTLPPPRPAKASFAAIAQSKSGCLAEVPAGAAPRFAFSPSERQALVAFLEQGTRGAGSPAPAHAARAALTRFHCLACHSRDGEGGLSPELVEHLRQFEKAENAEMVTPPPLTGLGHKLRTPWIREVLTNRGRARPWMGLRMPQFGPDNVGFLAEAVAYLEGTEPDDKLHQVPLSAATIQAGRELVGKSAFGCISCHDIAGIPNFGTRGPDLASMNQRVRYDWYVRWLSEAQRLQPGTRMPTVFPEGRSLYDKLLGGQPLRQAEAMWAYLSLGPNLPLPEGLEPPKGLILTVKDRPILLRTFMPDAGARSMAIGYPGGVALAFDAGAGRLAYGWSGNFLNAAPVWADRGGNPAKILGPKFWTSPAGTAWAVGAANVPPDFAAIARDPAWGGPLADNQIFQGVKQYQFLGYATDAGGLPTFRYRIHAGDPNPIDIDERPEPLRSAVAVGVRRKFTLALPPRRTAWFHAGESTAAPRVLDGKGNPQPFDAQSDRLELPIADRLIALPQGQGLTVLGVPAGPDAARWLLLKQGTTWHAYLRLPEKPGEVNVDVNVWAPFKDEPGLLKELVASK